MVKVDFHTHSVASPDGSITLEQYAMILATGLLDCIAITDHNRIDFAQYAQKELGSSKIIIGEEISTVSGEIIGLFIDKEIPKNLSLAETVAHIKEQGGLVYIPHPFETVRKGIQKHLLETLKDSIDIIETRNGRAFFQNFGPQAQAWAVMHGVPQAASSDAHRWQGLGRTYTQLAAVPTRKTLVSLVAESRYAYKRPLMRDVIAPKQNRLRKKISRKKRFQ